ncbi:hypothetical protein ANCCEY_13230 [Ancylostoma ceylanicum]|uniref:Uncharacterized protein n=1 Tax=Ancylostoma ceylanicum TaxID=53326 RepID=A0A0D6L7Y3_9BILA|nr:hypothetical protein ANCCEY_13230 [Ancylostoma ceylanicum]
MTYAYRQQFPEAKLMEGLLGKSLKHPRVSFNCQVVVFGFAARALSNSVLFTNDGHRGRLCENIQEEQNETQHPQQQPSCRMMAREKCDSGDDNNGGSVRSAGKMGEISRQDSTLSFESIDDSNEMKNSAEETWKQSKEAKASLLTALTAFYSLFLTIFALVLELSHLLSGEEQREINMKDMLSITGHHTAARFGTMHLIAANLWTWIRYVLMEEGVMEKEISTSSQRSDA